MGLGSPERQKQVVNVLEQAGQVQAAIIKKYFGSDNDAALNFITEHSKSFREWAETHADWQVDIEDGESLDRIYSDFLKFEEANKTEDETLH